jgi:hypothetical protein
MKAEVASATVAGAEDLVLLVQRAERDLRSAGSVADLRFSPDVGEITVDVQLAAPAS